MDTNSRNLVRGERVFGKAITYHAWWWRNRFLPHAILDKIVAALQVEAQYRLDKVYDIFLKPLPWWFETEGCWCYYYYSSSQGDQLCAWENTGDQPLDLAILLCFFSFFFGECPSPFWYWWWSEASFNLIFTLSLLLWKLACYKIEIEKHTGWPRPFLCERNAYISFNFEVTQKSLNMGRFENYTFYLSKIGKF